MGEVVGAATRPESSGRFFTVGIPVFNGKSLLRNCLQSVINSTFPRDRFEIVIADDGSYEPETRAILTEFQTKLAAQAGFFRVLTSGTNSGGAARPRNRILDEAAGDYVFFVDSDDTIGNLALERIAAALAVTPADWVAVNQVPVNGRAAVFRVGQPHAEVSRERALKTLTIHKVFRREEIERQRLRFDEGLPSGQDVSFAFSFILNAERFLMLGGYDYYYLTQHAGNLQEPGHLSASANAPAARIQKNERILRSMLATVRQSDLPESDRREILSQIILPRVLIGQQHLRAIVDAGPEPGAQALRRLGDEFRDPLIVDLEPSDLDAAALKGLTRQHLSAIAETDWFGLASLVRPGYQRPRSGLGQRWLARGRQFVDRASGRARHRQIVHELARLSRTVELMRDEQRRLEAVLNAQISAADDASRRH